MKFEKLQPGMTVYDVGRTRMGNTTLSTVSVWTVTIVSVDCERRRVVASWNHNTPREYTEYTSNKWREKRPLLIRDSIGRYSIATREEQKKKALLTEVAEFK